MSETPKTKKRPQGHGGVDELPSGRFRVRVRVPGKGRRSMTFDTRAEAERVVRHENEGLRVLATICDPLVTQQAARALLSAVAERDEVDPQLIEDLVAAVLGSGVAALALRAREPGPGQVMAAVRLAIAITKAADAYQALQNTGKGA